MKGQLYHYRVKHPEYGEADVTAEDRLQAACAVAKEWGVPWTAVARACTFERLGPAPAPAPPKKSRTSRRAKTVRGI